MRTSLIALSLFCLAGSALTGCSQTTGETTKMSAKDAANFKGGPMPPEARVEMAKRFAAINAANPGRPVGPAGPPAAK